MFKCHIRTHKIEKSTFTFKTFQPLVQLFVVVAASSSRSRPAEDSDKNSHVRDYSQELTLAEKIPKFMELEF